MSNVTNCPYISKAIHCHYYDLYRIATLTTSVTGGYASTDWLPARISSQLLGGLVIAY